MVSLRHESTVVQLFLSFLCAEIIVENREEAAPHDAMMETMMETKQTSVWINGKEYALRDGLGGMTLLEFVRGTRKRRRKTRGQTVCMREAEEFSGACVCVCVCVLYESTCLHVNDGEETI